MTSLSNTDGRPTITERLVLLAVASFVYVGLPHLGRETGRPPVHFPQLAEAFLHGKLSIEMPPESGLRDLNELIPAAPPASYYCPYPPLPAVLLMPCVAILGPAANVDVACRIVSVLNVLLFGACLWRLPRRLALPPLEPAARVAFTLLFAFGTVCWHNAAMGGDWHFAHAVALAAMLLALREFLAGNRPFVVGCLVGLAVLTRPTAALTGLFFAIPLIRARQVPGLVKLTAAPAAAVFLLALYNHARFGSPTDFGYDRMLLQGAGGQLMERYGQFHPHFVPRNVFWFFLAPPWPLREARFPFLGYDPRGLSLFLASPAMAYALLALRRRWHRAEVRDALAGVAACLVPLLLYFNTGYWQFGHRFSMDYLPLLMLLVVGGVGARPSRLAYGLITASIAIQVVGVLLDPVTRLQLCGAVLC